MPESYYMVRLLRRADGIRLEVADSSPELPVARTADALAESGRGLEPLEMVTDAWDAEPSGDGKDKTVWCEPKAVSR